MLPTIFHETMFDDLFNDFGRDLMNIDRTLYGKNAKNLMKTDVKDEGDHYEVSVDLPGFSKDEVSVELKEGYLTITAAKGVDKDEKDKKSNYIRQERYAGSMTRSFYVGDVRPEDVHGKYDSGVLTLEVPKAGQPKVEPTTHIAIEG